MQAIKDRMICLDVAHEALKQQLLMLDHLAKIYKSSDEGGWSCNLTSDKLLASKHKVSSSGYFH